MLDRCWDGSVGRISPEAPVPVLRVARRHDRPGGAANVATGPAVQAFGTAVLTQDELVDAWEANR